MQIVFSREAADELRAKYTVLELETFEVRNNEFLETFCVVPSEKLVFMDLTKLDEQKELHNVFLKAVMAKDWKKIIGLYDSVLGNFGGELDSFYSEIVSRANLNLD